MEGISKLQILAAIITPPVNPSMPSMMFLFTFLNKKTEAAPNAATSQVNKVAYSTASIGSMLSR
ncbi:hypothetical protein ACFSKL_07300 [Belliella marina]|uniref:Uncharacterized protein n=1 Tax=Belliella marina TaxID=1644146 RepID=A0ABW4VMU9_9BACT